MVVNIGPHLNNPDAQNRSLYAVFFLDSDNGWAVGAEGIVLNTDNGGTNWTIVANGLTTAFLLGVQFTSLTNGRGEIFLINNIQAFCGMFS